MTELITYYPELKSVNEKGKAVTEYLNKYWMMLSEAENLEMYPEKGMQKYILLESLNMSCPTTVMHCPIL